MTPCFPSANYERSKITGIKKILKNIEKNKEILKK